MTEFRARIGRIRMKNGGAVVRVLDRKPINPNGEDWRGRLTLAARKIADQGTEAAPLAGYFVMGVFADGATSTGFRYDPDQLSAIPRTLWPAFAAEIIRRDLIVENEARAVFSDMFEWRE